MQRLPTSLGGSVSRRLPRVCVCLFVLFSGAGLPFLIFTLSTGTPIATPVTGLLELVTCLSAIIFVYLVLVLAPVRTTGQAGLNKRGGWVLLGTFFGAYVYFVVTQVQG